VLAAILHLGNIAFARVDARDGKCDITNGAQDNVLDQEEKKDEDCDDDIVTHAVEYAAHLLVCAEDDLRKALLSRRLLVGGEWIDVPLTLEQAQDNRDALSKVCMRTSCCVCFDVIPGLSSPGAVFSDV
jgi:myosin heavy subunit